MPIVFVHGNPGTTAIWDELRTHLGREDVVAVATGIRRVRPCGLRGNDRRVSGLARE